MEIYRFRYDVYVDEMSKQLKDIDHDSKLLYNAMDEWGILLNAKVGSTIIGTIRVNIGGLSEFPSYVVQTQLIDRFQQFYKDKSNPKFAFTSMLMISPKYRNSQTSYLLMAKVYELCCKYKVQFSFGACNFHVLRFYEQFGLRRYGKTILIPGYGLMHPVVLLIDDVEHLHKVRSPLFRHARKRGNIDSTQVVKWFFSEFPEASSFINSQQITEETLWTIVNNRLGRVPHLVMPILWGLFETEARKFLHRCGVIVQCHDADQIITCGDTSNELNILLAGRLQASRFGQFKYDIIPGQHFGATGFIDYAKQTEDVVATTESEILVLSRLNFPKFLQQYPNIAQKVLKNLSSLVDAHQNTGGERHE